jgi:L-alanine-DL-glutamate epimerase-like enolase superfamily enzyme
MILCDANQARGRNLSGISWDMDRALVTGEAYQELGVGWLEEPLARTDLDGLAALNSRLDILLAGGENNVDLADFRHYAIRDCFGCWQPEVMLTGPGRFFKIAALAEAFGVTIIPHEGYQSLGTICQMHIAAALRSPYVEVLHNPPVSAYQNYVLPYLDAPVITDAGFVLLPEKPGLGVTLDRDLIEAEY